MSATIRVTPDDLALFAAASGDRNPLHLCPDYCRGTAFGTPVVYGVLGAIAALGRVPRRPDQRVRRVTLDFSGAISTGVAYHARVSGGDGADAISVELRDGSRPVLTVAIELAAGPPARLAVAPARFETTEPRDWTRDDDPPGESRYAPDAHALRSLTNRWRPAGYGVDDATLAVLLWASYTVGMERPGRPALFSRLDIEFAADAGACPTPFACRPETIAFDERFDLLRVRSTVGPAARPFATVETRAFVRRPVPPLDAARLAGAVTPAAPLSGRRALVTGAGRGLGAAIAGALATAGCDVHANERRSADGARSLRAAFAAAPGAIDPAPGDATDPAWARTVAEGPAPPDILILNACPPTMPLALDASSAARFDDYVARSLALARVPLAACVEGLAARRGWLVVISSTYVTDPPAALPHYVCAKHALEGLARATAAAHPGIGVVIVRPPKLRTELSNLPMGTAGALAPEDAAAAIVNRLARGERRGGVAEVLTVGPAATPVRRAA